MPRTRRNNGKPNCCSACCNTLLTAGCETCSNCAAALIEPVWRMAWKISIWRRRMASP
ncbi:hypothetical protein D9M69_505560 [compost metagenome]